MPISIRCIPYREPLIGHVADAATSPGASLDETAVVFASSRAISHFRGAIAERAGNDAIAGPYTYTLDDFIQRSLAPNGSLAFPGEIERRSLLNRAIRNCRQDMSPLFRGADKSFLNDFLAFSSIGDRLLRFYDEITLEGVSFDDLRRNSLYTDFEKHVAVLEAVFMQYNRELEANGFVDLPGFKARGQVDDAFIRRFRRIVVAISGLPTRSELRIIRDISGRVEVSVIMSHEGPLLRGQKEIAETLGAAIDAPHENSPLPELAIHEFGDAVTQAGFIAESIDTCRKHGIPDERIAVVLADEGFAGTLMAVLGRDPFNVAMGLPLRESPWFGLLAAALELFASFDDNGYNARALAAFLAQPLVSRIKRDEQEFRQLPDMQKDLQKEINDRLLLRVPQKMLENYPAISGEVEKARPLFKAENLRDAASAAFKYLTDLEGRLSPEFRKTLHENRDARSARKKALDLLAECAASTLASGIAGEALSILLATLESEKYTAVNRGGGISVIGVLETRGLSFDAVIMPDMNEGIMPAASRKDMFLNTAIRRAVGLPTPEDREALYGIYLNNLLCGAKTAFLSYVNSSDRPARSRFIEKMLIENPGKSNLPGMAVATGSAVEKAWVVPGRFRVSPPPKAARKDEAALARLHELNYSASSIGAYLSCRYRFYLQYVCRLAEPVTISEELAASMRGDIFHKAVKALYEGGADDDLFRDAQAHHAMLCDAINKEAEKYDQARIVASNRFALENWKGRLTAFSASEVELYRAGWRNAGREKKIEVVNPAGRKLKGTIDRIDRLDDSIRIIDYKTGSLPPKKECRLEGGRDGFRRIQLPFYLLLLALGDGIDPASVEGLYYYDLKKDFGLVSLHEDFRDGRRAYLRGFTAFIDEVLAEIFDPSVEFRHAEDRRECVWCPYDLSCRVGEMG